MTSLSEYEDQKKKNMFPECHGNTGKWLRETYIRFTSNVLFLECYGYNIGDQTFHISSCMVIQTQSPTLFIIQ